MELPYAVVTHLIERRYSTLARVSPTIIDGRYRRDLVDLVVSVL